MEPLTFDQFVAWLRSALHHLYDPDQLRRSPLARLFGIEGFDAAATLQRILIEAIESLQPAPTESAQSRAWRIYDALAYRYVRGFDRDAVADQLGISGRQLRREQRAALEVLADVLWKQFGLARMAAAAPTIEPKNPDATSAPAWLRDLPPDKPAELGQLLPATLDLARSLARQWNVELREELDEELRTAAVPQVAVRYALLGLLGILIPRSRGGTVVVSVGRTAAGAQLSVAGSLAETDAGLSEREALNLEVTRQLVEAIGGRLTLEPAAGGRSLVARCDLPMQRRTLVLAVDDNPDVLQLFERYVAGTAYGLATTREPGQCLRLARELAPDIIVLDVMMPGVDGWDLLAQLRSDGATANAAVIVCTVLPQESLALALGADAFLQKPVSREEFLAALDRHRLRDLSG